MLTVEQLAAAAVACTDAEERARIDIVRLLVAGFSRDEVASMTNRGASTVKDVHRRYLAQGLDGLRDRRRRGFQLSPDQTAELEGALAGPPPAGERAWTGAAVRRFLQRKYDRRVSDHRARQLLHAVL